MTKSFPTPKLAGSKHMVLNVFSSQWSRTKSVLWWQSWYFS